MAKTAQGLIAYAKAQVGRPYWFGTFGQTATAALHKTKASQYPSYYRDADFPSQYGQRVHDCIGLIKGYLWSESPTAAPKYNASQDVNAARMYAISLNKGKISSFPKKAGMLVYKGSSEAKISHVGIYDGSGYVYEAKGHRYGVVKTPFRSADWPYWSECKFIRYETAESPQNVQVDRSGVKDIWTSLLAEIGNEKGVAALMGNLYAESALNSRNLQNTTEKRLGMSDDEYTRAVDNGTYTNFERDSGGYGLAQWTYHTRKAALLKFCQERKASIGSQAAQIAFLIKELKEDYRSVYAALKVAESVREASDIVLTKFERPADQSEAVKLKRASYGMKYYDQYHVEPKEEKTSVKLDNAQKHEAGHSRGTKLKAMTDVNMRTGAGTDKDKIRVISENEIVTWYGYYSVRSGVKWYFVVDRTGRAGYISSKYLA